MSEHWTEGFEHASITDDNRGAFNTAMEKFPTPGDAAVGYMELQKNVGKPFKLPESVENLPDDASRADFVAQTRKLLGLSYPKTVEDLADVNFKDGLTDDAVVNDDMVGMLKKWAVDEGISKSALAKMVKLYNGPLADMGQSIQDKASSTKTAEKEAAMAACNEATLKHFGTPEKLTEQSVLLHRAFVKNVGASVEEAADLAEFMSKREGATNPALRKMLLQFIAPLAAESKTPGSPGGTVPVEQGDPDEGSKSYQDIGWSKKTTAPA